MAGLGRVSLLRSYSAANIRSIIAGTRNASSTSAGKGSEDGDNPIQYGVQGAAHLIPYVGVPYMKEPVKVELEAGKKYYWCSCGHSRSQPFCDGSHKREGYNCIRPVPYIPKKTMAAKLCLCKQTKNRPFCDGSHRELPEGSVEPKKWNYHAYSGSNNVPEGTARKLGLRARDGTFLNWR